MTHMATAPLTTPASLDVRAIGVPKRITTGSGG